MEQRETDDRLLLEGEVALTLGVSRAALRKMRWARTGPPFVKIGKRVRYRRSDLMRYLEAATVRTEEAKTDGAQSLDQT